MRLGLDSARSPTGGGGGSMATKEQQKKNARVVFVILGSIGAVVLCSQVMEGVREAELPKPTKQLAFCRGVELARKAYRTAIDEKNEIRQNQLTTRARLSRKMLLVELLPDGTITEWIGRVGRISDESFGGAVGVQVRFGLGCDALLVTTNDLSAHRSELGRLEVRQYVTVSGMLVPDPTGKDAFKELSLTETGGMLEPEFAFELSLMESID